MKKTINGIRYNTEAATLIGEYHTPGLGQSDFKYWEAGLYKAPRSGRFFLAGEGHAMTRFASHHGSASGWGERIIPMDKNEALEWAEQFLDEDAIEEYFSDMIEDA
jgi:hypothetical protein